MAQSVTKEVVDKVLTYLADKTPLVCAAHEELGVPLDELLCHAVRAVLARRLVESPEKEQLKP